jgi:hypothetical protein
MKNVDTFVNCEKCGKRLIERKKNGVWHFAFGKSDDIHGSPVELFIFGSIKIKCIRKSCSHWNVLDCFPEVADYGIGHQTVSSRT